MGMTMSSEAISIDEGKVDEKYFQAPEGIVAEYVPEADNMARQIAMQTMDWLKDPNAENTQPNLMPMDMGGSGRMEQIPEEDQKAMQEAMQMMQGLKDMMQN